jgi:hypothetical protein
MKKVGRAKQRGKVALTLQVMRLLNGKVLVELSGEELDRGAHPAGQEPSKGRGLGRRRTAKRSS